MVSGCVCVREGPMACVCLAVPCGEMRGRGVQKLWYLSLCVRFTVMDGTIADRVLHSCESVVVSRMRRLSSEEEIKNTEICTYKYFSRRYA
jgi:hypothetical protein